MAVAEIGVVLYNNYYVIMNQITYKKPSIREVVFTMRNVLVVDNKKV